MQKIYLRFYCKEHGYVDCGFDTPIQEIFFNQYGVIGRSCPLCYKSRPMEVEMCIGLEDNQGVKVYRNDALRWVDWEQELTTVPDIYIVAWDDELARFYLQCYRDGRRISDSQLDMSDLKEFEVIGSIHDYQDLLR